LGRVQRASHIDPVEIGDDIQKKKIALFGRLCFT